MAHIEVAGTGRLSSSFQPSLRHLVSTIGFTVAVVVATIVPQGIWSRLVAANLSLSPQVPWSAAAIGVVLWVILQYAGGRWPPATTAAARRQYIRTPRLRRPVFARALIAGFLSLASLTAAWLVLPHLVAMPVGRLPDYSKYPLL